MPGFKELRGGADHIYSFFHLNYKEKPPQSAVTGGGTPVGKTILNLSKLTPRIWEKSGVKIDTRWSIQASFRTASSPLESGNKWGKNQPLLEHPSSLWKGFLTPRIWKKLCKKTNPV